MRCSISTSLPQLRSPHRRVAARDRFVFSLLVTGPPWRHAPLLYRSRDRQVEEDFVRLHAGCRRVHDLRWHPPQLARPPRVRAGGGAATLPPPHCPRHGRFPTLMPPRMRASSRALNRPPDPPGEVPLREEARQADAVGPPWRHRLRPLRLRLLGQDQGGQGGRGRRVGNLLARGSTCTSPSLVEAELSREVICGAPVASPPLARRIWEIYMGCFRRVYGPKHQM